MTWQAVRHAQLRSSAQRDQPGISHQRQSGDLLRSARTAVGDAALHDLAGRKPYQAAVSGFRDDGAAGADSPAAQRHRSSDDQRSPYNFPDQPPDLPPRLPHVFATDTREALLIASTAALSPVNMQSDARQPANGKLARSASETHIAIDRNVRFSHQFDRSFNKDVLLVIVHRLAVDQDGIARESIMRARNVDATLPWVD